MDDRVTRRAALRRGALVGTGVGLAGLAGCVSTPTRPALLAEGFETDLSGWDVDAHIGPEEPIEAFDYRVERSRERAANGDWSLELFTEGDHDDGTAWVVTSVDPPADTERFSATVRAWSDVESFNTLRCLVCYLGPERPTSEADFPRPNTNTTDQAGVPAGGLREPLHRAAGWETYTFEWLPDEMPGTLYFAVGVSVVWESDATHYVDDVRVVAN